MKVMIKKLTALVFVLTVFSACNNRFEEINTNPNAPISVTSSLLLPQIIRDMVNATLGEAWGIGNIVIQHTAKNQFVNEDRYLWGELNSIWNNVYSNMRDLKIIIDQSEASNQRNYKGIALILKSWMFSLATDCYGDIPYSEAIRGKSDGINFPKYDTQESIYAGILADLAEANTILGTTGEIVAGDPIFNGDVTKWKRLANSLRLRYLMRISNKRNVAADMAAIVSNPNANPIMTGNSDNANYNYLANAPDQFPLFTTRIGSFNEFRASKTLMDVLTGFNDPRRNIFFRPTPATELTPDTSDDQYVGIPNGLGDVEALQFNGGPQNQSRIGALFYEEANTSRGLSIAKGVIMNYSELQFILAEAAKKGLIAGGDAQARIYYENGINASFAYYGLSTPIGYLAQTGVAYNPANALVQIGTQKWISFFFQGLEAWFDWRRTNIPALRPAATNQTNGIIPTRFIYPLSEQSLNTQNRVEAVTRQGADAITTKVWWNK
ncbi:MAG: SusD/RagB family nutrient-binding outer membrane lipoprotein [Thermoflexibacter sp.]